MYLMYKDEKILFFDFKDNNIVIINNKLLPYSLRSVNFNDTSVNGIINSILKLKEYFSSRVLSLSRSNAKKLYTMFQLQQSDRIDDRVEICLKCRGVSLQDSYWVSFKEEEKWENYNIRHKKFKEIIDISLYGSYPSISISPLNPELTTMGLFPKGWVREKDDLCLLKTDNYSDFVNTKMEVLASEILQCFNIKAVEYSGRYRNTKEGRFYVNKCKNFVNDDLSFVEAREVIDYCRNSGVSFETICLTNFKSDFANIPVIDYIIMNTDRHTQNYGFMMNDKGILVCVAPLFDFNCALVSDYFGRYVGDTLNQMFQRNESIEDCMSRYLPYSNIEFNYDKFKELIIKRKKYKHILNNVLDRVKKIGLV